VNVCEVNSINVTGLVVRTTNADEMNQSTAKIGSLWENFYKNASPNLSENSKVYGLYTNYESDAAGAFDVVACSDTLSPEVLDGSVKFQISAGKYLKFSAKGEMPQVVINLWGEIWEYFNSDGCSHERAYTTDFECYKSESEVEIFIALK
jgi:predicted transcriptional regulator YdeE